MYMGKLTIYEIRKAHQMHPSPYSVFLYNVIFYELPGTSICIEVGLQSVLFSLYILLFQFHLENHIYTFIHEDDQIDRITYK